MSVLPSSVLGSLVYPPQAHGLKPNKTHETLRDSALDTSALNLTPPADDKGIGAYEMKPISANLSERTRRLSAVTRTTLAIHISGDVSKDPISQENPFAQDSATSLPVLPFDSENPTVSRLADRQFRRNSIIQFITLCWCIFVEGWSDGSTGPLLPVIQRDHHVRYLLTSSDSTILIESRSDSRLSPYTSSLTVWYFESSVDDVPSPYC
jgi:hypothetical protein